MIKTSVIAKAEFTNDWKHPMAKEPYYYHKIVFKNGDEGTYAAKQKYPMTICAGNTVEYEIGAEGKIKIIKSVSPNQAKPEEKKEESNTQEKQFTPRKRSQDEFLGYSFSYAKDLLIAGKTMKDMDALDNAATTIYNRIGELLKNPQSKPNAPLSPAPPVPAIKEPIKVSKKAQKEIDAAIPKAEPKKKGRPRKSEQQG